MKTIFRSLTFLTTAIILLIVLSAAGICVIFAIPDKTEDVTTDYGDSFRIYYDGFQAKTLISDNRSSFYIIVGDKVDKNDIVGLTNDTDLRAYKIKDIIFYDDGNGFEFFDNDTTNQKVIHLAKSISNEQLSVSIKKQSLQP